MKNFKLTLEYDGTDFHGWQIQPGVRTVQGELESVLGQLLGDPVRVDGCCRTDAGVHAVGFVGSFRSDTRLMPGQLEGALAANLPEDIAVREAKLAGEGFHARHSCVARRYAYRITTVRPSLYRRHLAWSKYDLDVGPMSLGAEAILGTHDFSSFAPAALDPDVSPVCTVTEASISCGGDTIRFDVKADRFLHHMVRNIVGTLMEVGRGRFAPEQVGEIMRKRDRRAAGPTAPACGLVLMEACYDGRDCP
ncbi:MAG: tRNA pseudouridine(38-40) synthase TruA [Candidatus Latescibacterota bacterium]|jgi:tRNA pseudouridine38-40 synthase